MDSSTGVPRSSKFYGFIRSHLLWYKIMFNKCCRDLLLLKIMSEKILNWMWSEQKSRVKCRVKYASKKENENWRHTSCLDRLRSPVILETTRDFKAKQAYAGVDWKSIKNIWKHSWNLCQIYQKRQTVKNVLIQ